MADDTYLIDDSEFKTPLYSDKKIPKLNPPYKKVFKEEDVPLPFKGTTKISTPTNKKES